MENASNNKGQIVLIIIQAVAMIALAVSVVLNWNYKMWEDVQFEIRDGRVAEDLLMPIIGSLEHLFSSTEKILLVFALTFVLSLILTVALFVLCSKKSIARYYKFLSSSFGLSFAVSIVLYILMFNVYHVAMIVIYNVAWSFVFVLLLPFILLMVKTCYKCFYFNTKVCTEKDSYTTYSPKYVEGGYRTVKADVKDSGGNVIGTIEAKKYEEGYTYTSSSTSQTKTYVCTNCGDVTTTTSSS